MEIEDSNEDDDASAFSVKMHTQSVDMQNLRQMHQTPHADAPWCMSFSDFRLLVPRRQVKPASPSGTMAMPRQRMFL